MKEKIFAFCILSIIIASFVTLYIYCKNSGASQAELSDRSSEEIIDGSSVEETISYRLTLTAEPSSAGTVSGEGEYETGAGVTLVATTKTGYEFLGWYEGETRIGETLTHRFSMPSENKSYVARWRICTYSVTAVAEPSSGGSVSGGGTYAFGSEVTLVTTPVSGYAFVGWYEGENKIEEASASSYLFVLSAQNRSITAKYERVLTRLDDDYVLFGSYPQSAVSEASVATALNAQAGDLPTVDGSGSWTPYDYYINNSNGTNFMWYKDITYGEEKYRGVYFISYRPEYTNVGGSASNSNQDDNGYHTSIVYWFKFEPIKWRILSEANGEALILCEKIIDSQAYNNRATERTINDQTVYANNYAESNIRKWLNETFCNTAFNGFEKQWIVSTTVDNSARSTSDSGNNLMQASFYACEDTEDDIFLLSEQEVTNEAYGFDGSYLDSYDPARQKKNTDYAKSQGVQTSTVAEYEDNGSWWLRSPDCINDAYAHSVYDYGDADLYGYVNNTGGGVVPALKIRI